MRIIEIFNLVILNILHNKFKVLLTSLGIIVGAATIVMVIAIGEGGKADVEEQFKNLNAGTIEISSGGSSMDNMFSMMEAMPRAAQQGGDRPTGTPNAGGGGGMPGMGGPTITRSATLSMDEVEEIRYFVPDIDYVTLAETTTSEVDGGLLEEALTDTNIVGTTSEYPIITNMTMAVGEFITSEMEDDTLRQVVLGYNIAVEMFGSPILAYDSEITIDGKRYSVMGVLNPVNAVVTEVTVDDAIYMPYGTAKKYLFAGGSTPQLIALVEDISKVDSVMLEIDNLLSSMHEGTNFNISDAGEAIEAARNSANTLSTLLTAVATIVFIVGGIGIMNVLFVSVKERTQEIGILKALGTSKIDILLQFLIEANMISVLGGVLGVGIAAAMMPVMEYTGMRVEPSPMGSVLALVFAVITGTVFGFYPAYKAANLRPIEALNDE